MRFQIYGFNNEPRTILLLNRDVADISQIFVRVLSGDETGFVEFTDGKREYFDSSCSRFTEYFDGEYIVKGEDIPKWLEFRASSGTIAYRRRDKFMNRVMI